MLVGDSAMPSGSGSSCWTSGCQAGKYAARFVEPGGLTPARRLGTPQYMSPEQYRDVSQVDGMTDVCAGIIPAR